MSNQSSAIVQRLWNYCNVLRDEGRLSVADEIEKEPDGALVRAEGLRRAVLKSAFEGMV